LGDARLAAATGAVAESIYPFGVEAVEALPYGLRMTSELLGDPGRAEPFPAQGGDAGSRDSVSRGVAAAGQFTDLPPFLRILGCAGVQQLRHVLFSFSYRRFGHALLCTTFEERSHSGT
jgi:hypothetical protein